MKTLRIMLLATGVLASATVVAAEPAAAPEPPGLMDFVGCDGQGFPELDDGFGDYVRWPSDPGYDMTQTSDLRAVRSLATLGGERAAACDRALANPGLLPQNFPRRAHLLRARAFHQAKNDDFDGAMASLEAADAEIGKTPAWIDQDSFLTGSDMLRAHLLIAAGRKPEAADMVTRFASRWPHSETIQTLAYAFGRRIDGSRANELALLEQQAVRSPSALRRQVGRAAIFGRYDMVDRLGGLIRMQPPAPLPGWKPAPQPSSQDPLVADAQVAGLWAYAAAILGRADDAGTRIAAMRRKVEASMAPPSGGKAPARNDRKGQKLRLEVGGHATRALDEWQTAIDLQSKLAAMDAETAVATIEGSGVPPLARLGLLRSLAERGNAGAVAALAPLEASVDEQVAALPLGLEDVYRAIPGMMTRAAMPYYRRSVDIEFVTTDDNGYSARPEGPQDGTIYTIRFTHEFAPPHIIDELLEMACGRYARDKGYDGFILLNRRLVERSYAGRRVLGAVYHPRPAGHEAAARVIFVRSAALPPDLESERWRIVDAATTFDSIYAKYFARQDEIRADQSYSRRP